LRETSFLAGQDKSNQWMGVSVSSQNTNEGNALVSSHTLDALTVINYYG